MKQYVVYDGVGKILRSGQCQDSMLQAQAQVGEFVVEGRANDLVQKILGGRIVSKTPEEIERDKLPTAKIPDTQPITTADWQALQQRLANCEAKFATFGSTSEAEPLLK